MVHAMRDHFGVGLGGERVAQLLQLFAQLFVVLDDAVVDDGEAVVRDVRMRVALGRHAVRRPARVRDAELAVGRIRVDRVLQHLHLADGAQALEFGGAVQYGDAGGVVAAVFEPAQSLHQDGDDVALSDRSDDSAHLTVSRTRGARSVPERRAGSKRPTPSRAHIWYSAHIGARLGTLRIGNQYLTAAKTGQNAYKTAAASRHRVAMRLPARGMPNQ